MSFFSGETGMLEERSERTLLDMFAVIRTCRVIERWYAIGGSW